MTSVEINLNEQIYQASAELGTTLKKYFLDQGVDVPDLLFSSAGRPVSTDYTLVHSVAGAVLVTQGQSSPAVPALVPGDVLSATIEA